MRFWRRLLLLVLTATMLTLCWARFQPGRLYYFNTYYAGSLMLIVLYLACDGCLPNARDRSLRDCRETWLAAGAILFCGTLGLAPFSGNAITPGPRSGTTSTSERSIGPEVAGILARHPPERRPVVVRFPVWKWDEATTPWNSIGGASLR